MVRKIGKNDSFIYSTEIRYVQNGERIHKKKQITAREYIHLLEQKDPSKKQVRKIRQCFIFERQYFMVESFTNVDGNPSILRVESTGEAQKIMLPPFVKVLREVTNEEFYHTKFMASTNYKMPESDKLDI
jgi:CYTH domain-containing protein